MANVPIEIAYTSIADSYMVCRKHNERLPFRPDRKATAPVDGAHWYMCPALAGELNDFSTSNLELRAAERGINTNELVELLDDEDRVTWQLVIVVEDATVAIA